MTQRWETVGELRAFLEREQWSAETLAARVPVSNMTWRRLLAKPDDAPLPEKYRALLAPLVASQAPAPASLDPEAVVLTGLDQTRAQVLAGLTKQGEAVPDAAVVLRDSEQKRRSIGLSPARLGGLLLSLKRAFPAAGAGARALIVGGFLYFLNPFDLIADGILTFGLVDDVGVLSLIQARLFARRSKA